MNRIWLAANGGNPFLEPLMAAGEVPVDRVKVGPWMGDAALTVTAAAHPLLLHISDGVVWPRGERWIREQLVRTEWMRVPWISAHLELNSRVLNYHWSFPPLIPRSLGLHWAVRTVQRWAKRSPVPVLVENMARSRPDGHPYLVEPAFICQVVQESDCFFLLDLAHAQVSAAMRGEAVQDYVRQLPLDRLVEIHVSGPRPHPKNGRLVDAHQTLQETDYELLAWTLTLVRPRAVSLEYWLDGKEIKRQLLRLHEILESA